MNNIGRNLLLYVVMKG